MSNFAVDTTQPVPGPYRMPTENERRCRIYLKHHFQDCTDLCEVHPDIAEHTDATMRLLAASWDMRELLKTVNAFAGCTEDLDIEAVARKAKAILTYIEKG